MRVIGGKYRGKKLVSPKNDARPTLDRIKENLFNILRDRVLGSTFLDLFGGTGAIGLEAASRGAKSVTIIDNDEAAVLTIKRNLSGITEPVSVIKANGLEYLKQAKGFSIIYIDPPYKDGVYNEALELIKKGEALDDGGLIILESEAPLTIPDGLTKIDERKYGRVYLTFVNRG